MRATLPSSRRRCSSLRVFRPQGWVYRILARQQMLRKSFFRGRFFRRNVGQVGSSGRGCWTAVSRVDTGKNFFSVMKYYSRVGDGALRYRRRYFSICCESANCKINDKQKLSYPENDRKIISKTNPEKTDYTENQAEKSSYKYCKPKKITIFASLYGIEK